MTFKLKLAKLNLLNSPAEPFSLDIYYEAR